MTNLVQRFERNTRGRDIIVGDVHGTFTKLMEALRAIGFDPDAGDRLFHVGDLVDRGPESLLAVKWLEQPWVHSVQGNHEDMAIRWPNGNMDWGNYAANGGSWMMALDRETQRLVADTLSALPIAIELETEAGLVGIVHAECPVSPWQDFTAMLEDTTLSNGKRQGLIDAATWARTRIQMGDDSLIAGVRAVVVGHTPMERMTSLGNTLFIDTMGWRRGITLLIEGGAEGADRLARGWAQRNGIEVETVEADWRRYGPAAGPIRNGLMLTKWKPDGVVAFPGGRGTADMISRAEAAGLRVWRTGGWPAA